MPSVSSPCCWLAAWAVLSSVLPGCRAVPMPAPLSLTPADAPAAIRQAGSRGLVPVTKFDPTLTVRLPYAGPGNAFGRTLYPEHFPALAAEGTARRLAAANRQLHASGLRIRVLDAWRPPEVQWLLFKMFRDPDFVADPRRKWSKHCYGRAVDVTLTGLDGRELEMPSAFDDFTPRASAVYSGNDPGIRRRLRLLQQAMISAGFTVYSGEWWHFNDLTDPSVFAGPPVFGRDLGFSIQEKP